MSEFSFVMGDVPKVEGEEKPFVRDDSDNKLFTEIQVKDITSIITKDCIGYKDSDTMIYKACQNVERKFIKAVNIHTKEEKVLEKVTDFWGRGKAIKEGTVLFEMNEDRVLLGEEPWTKEDFEIVDCQELKYDKKKAIEQAKIQIHKTLKRERLQYRIPKIVMVIGEGDNFRSFLPLNRPYKGERKKVLRPLILKEIREWAVKEMGAVEAEPRWDGQMVEADDKTEYFGNIGFRHYLETGLYNTLVLASDKDAGGNPKLWVNPDTHVGENNPLQGKFKMPQAMQIPSSNESAGGIEKSFNTKGELQGLKGYGFLWILYQGILGKDQADAYDALGHLKDSGYNLNFGDESAYKVLKPCKNSKEALQAAIDTVAKLLPYGVEYTDFKGDKHDVDTLTYLNTYFLTAYMLRHDKDKMDLFTLCKLFKVDTSAIENNNLLTEPYEVFNEDNAETIIASYDNVIDHILNNNLKAYKSGKKQELVDAMDSIKEMLLEQRKLSSEGKTKLVQKNKATGEIIDYIEGE